MRSFIGKFNIEKIKYFAKNIYLKYLQYYFNVYIKKYFTIPNTNRLFLSLPLLSILFLILNYCTNNKLLNSLEAIPNYYLSSNTTSAGTAAGTLFTAVSSTGFSIGNSSLVNTNSDNYVAWNWTVASSSGFEVVKYTGTGVAHTISHTLGATPSFIMIKRTDSASNWFVYHTSTGNTGYTSLNSTGAFTTDSTANLAAGPWSDPTSGS
jgi:hypothetical protein